MASSHSVLVVDDQAPFRLAAKAVLRRLAGFELAGEASSGYEAIELVDQLHPELVLMDINMPQMNGIEATRQILAAHPGTVVILCSTYDVRDLPADAERQRRGRVRPQGAAGRRPAAPAMGAPRRGLARTDENQAVGSERDRALHGGALAGLRLPAHGPADGAEPVGHVRVPVPGARTGHVESRPVVGDREQQAARLLPQPDVTVAPGACLAAFCRASRQQK